MVTNNTESSRIVVDSAQMEQFGQQLATAMKNLHIKSLTLSLAGALGVGKTTLVRGIMRAYGYVDKIKSPTFTIVEEYFVHDKNQLPQKIYHFDLYRIQSDNELEAMGFRDYFVEDALKLIEWPSTVSASYLNVDLKIIIKYLEHGRLVTLQSSSVLGQAVITQKAIC